MSSIAFISSSVLKLALLLGAIPAVTVPVTTSTVASGMFGAKTVPSVEGIAVETIGITSGG